MENSFVTLVSNHRLGAPIALQGGSELKKWGPASSNWHPLSCTESEKECTPEGYLLGANHMCNGTCIPLIIPCNNICFENVLWRTNRREALFGPVVCEEIDSDLERKTGLNTTMISRIFGNLSSYNIKCLF